MTVRFRAIIVALFVALAFGCSEKPVVKVSEDGQEASRLQRVRVVLALAGDDIGGPEAQALLGSLTTALERDQGLTIVSSGYGMGTVELVAEVAGGASNATMRKGVDEACRNARCRIETLAE